MLRSQQDLWESFPNHPPLDSDSTLLGMNTLSVENHCCSVGEDVAKLDPSHTGRGIAKWSGSTDSFTVPQNVKQSYWVTQLFHF